MKQAVTWIEGSGDRNWNDEKSAVEWDGERGQSGTGEKM